MKTIYYITRTIPGGGSGGSLIRFGTVKYLREAGYKVVVVALSNRNLENEDQIYIKGCTSRFFTRVNLALYNVGFLDDYLEFWAHAVFTKLKNRVSKKDIVLAVSGGELGPLIAASKLKKKIGCRIVFNLHDPIDFTTIDGEYSFTSNIKMRARDKEEANVFHNADAIVTSSQYYAEALKRKYPDLTHKLSCHHFGYIEKNTIIRGNAKENGRVNVVYGGNMGPLQGPEILIKLANYFPDVNFTFVGDFSYKGEKPSNVLIKQKMAYKDYILYLATFADIGFFSLVGNVSRLCIPSKLYEYINVGIPILAAIGGDSRNIVNDNGFGYATDYSVEQLVVALKTLLQGNNLEISRNAILCKRDKWFMKYTISELIQTLEVC